MAAPRYKDRKGEAPEESWLHDTALAEVTWAEFAYQVMPNGQHLGESHTAVQSRELASKLKTKPLRIGTMFNKQNHW